MAIKIRKSNYFYTTIKDIPGEAYKVLESLSELGLNLSSFQAIPMGPHSTQLVLFPFDEVEFVGNAKKIGMILDGPHPAILVQGDDEIGVLAKIHKRLYAASVNVYAANAVSDGKNFGYVIYIRPEEFDKACSVLDLK